MKVRIVLTSDNGEVWQGEVELVSRGGSHARAKASARRPKTSSKTGSESPDVKLPLRPFLKKYARDKGGAARITLLIAHIARGETDTPVSLTDLQSMWNRTTSFLGQFNRAYATRAKDKGWIDSPSHGVYVLRDSWTESAVASSQ